MKKSLKIKITVILAFAMCISLVFGLTLFSEQKTTVKAAEPDVFEMLGMSIRYSDAAGDDGIRFGVKLDLTTYNSLIMDDNAVAGVLITPSDLLTLSDMANKPLNLWNAAASKAAYGILYNGSEGLNEWRVDGEYAIGIVYLHGFPEASYNRPITAVAYIDWDNNSALQTTNYSDTVKVSMSDVALAVRDDYEDANNFETTSEQYALLDDYLLSYGVGFFGEDGNNLTTSQIKFGQTFAFPSDPDEFDGRPFLGWKKRVGGTDSPVWSEVLIDKGSEDLTVKKSIQYKACFGNQVEHTTVLQNKENIFGGDPSVTYKDGYYYYVYLDSKPKLYVLKSRSLEQLLNGYYSGWGSGHAACIYDPTDPSSANYNSAMAKKIWAPELEYIRGKWYIYVSGCSASSSGDTFDERMFVMECNSQDPTGTWKTPVQLSPSIVSGKYAIDGHAFEYKGQLYYTFSGRTSNSELVSPRIYICTMPDPTHVNNDAVNISKHSSLEEGPCTLIDGNDIYLMYSMGAYNGSASSASKDYHVDYYKCSDKDPMNASNWTQGGTLLQQSPSKDIYCTGHNHIFKGADGRWWTSYHAVVGTEGIGTSAYLSKRRVFVQPVTVSNGTLVYEDIKTTVNITDKGGLAYNDPEETSYYASGEDMGTFGRLWKNSGRSFTVSTTISRVDSGNFCAGITLYQRRGDGYLNQLLIGVEKEGEVFLCKDYARYGLYYKYVNWRWNDEGIVNLTVTYTAGINTSDSTLKIVVSNASGTKSFTNIFTIDQINAIVSDNVGEDTHDFDLHFTGDFEIGLGCNKNKCVFTNVNYYCNNDVELSWNNGWGNDWTPW